MKKYIPFVIYWLFNSLIIYLANSLFPLNVVLGNSNLSPLIAAFWFGAIVTLLAHLAKFLMNMKLGFVSFKGRGMRFLGYFLANSFFVWASARIPALTGIGISNFYWALILGLSLNIIQWIVRQLMKSSKIL